MSAGYPGMNRDEIKELESSARSGEKSASNPTANIDDQLLIQRIQKKLWDHTEVNGQKMEIIACDGIITLTGVVSSLEKKATIQALIEGTPGVMEVVNLLKLDKDHSGKAYLSLSREII
jgi:osmotically-inducible protein OsmY